MRKILLLAFVFLTTLTAFGQDFSNKGKDFWVGYGYHTSMLGGGGGSQDMVLYFATDQATNITISIPANGYTQNITTAAGNNVVTSIVIPKTGAQDAKLLVGGLSNNGIHITSNKPMVAYAHIYNGNCSGATILYPTNTLGREYYSVNYKNWSNNNNANCWFYVVATDTGTTTIEITPQADQIGVVTTPSSGSWVAGTKYVINLTQGQIYNVMGILTTANNPFKGVDLTGSLIKSVNNGSGCKKIGVFSGSGRISITCTAGSSSSDNYMVQALPRNAWGKKYLTVQANGNQSNNIYRVCVSHPAAIVKINGAVTGLPLLNNFYYEIPATAQPQLIEADSAIMVAQYFTSQGACGNGASPGDPEVIYLSAVEQNINKVIWYATPNFAITSHSLSIVIPNTGTALSSFTLNGAAVGGWVTHPQDPGYSYLRRNVNPGFNVMQSDSGFNATAYGFGGAESYGYNAGTNIKDLYQQIGVQTTYGIESTPSVCTNSPFKFKVSLPYIPDSMHWNFNGAAGMIPNNNTVYVDNTGNIAEDSFTVVNGRTIHWYSVPLTYTFTTIGSYPITITTFVPNGECGAEQDIDFDLGVSDPPIAGFTWTGGGCVADSFHFVETTPQFPKSTYKFWWNFGDPGSGVNNDTSNLRNPVHLFSAPGTYTVRYGSITTPGCLSDTLQQLVLVPDIPFATISGANSTVCINSAPPPDVTFTATEGTPPFTFTYTINAGAPQTVNSIGTNYSVTIQHPTNIAGQFIYDLTQVKNVGSTVCVRNIAGQKDTVNIIPDATVTLRAGDNDNQTVCVNNPIVNIRYDIGGSGNGGTVTGLPAGVTGTYAGGVITISGTPTTVIGSPFTYTINPTGPCAFPIPAKTGTITVDDDATIALTSAAGTDNQTKCINTAITDIDYLVAGGGTGATIAWLPSVPPGISFTPLGGGNFRISGTPTSAAGSPYSYIISTTGPCIKPTVAGTLTVTPDATVTLRAGDNDNQTVCVNNPIVNIRYDIAGSGNGGTVTGLPAGVTGTYAGGVITITGTPTTAIGSPFTYTINPTGPCAFPIPAKTGTITVDDDATIALTSAAGTDNQTKCINNAITDIDYLVAGGGTGATIVWAPGVPPGISFTPLGGGNFRISGTPTSAAGSPYSYTISTTGPCIKPTASGTLTVTPDATVTLRAGDNNNQTVCINNAIASIRYDIGGSGNGGTVTGLPAGVTGIYAGGVITISGTPTTTIGSPFIYTINPTGPCAFPIPAITGTITVTADATIALTSAAGTDNQTVCRNIAIANIDYTTAGSATGATIAWVPSAPTGITFTPLGGGNFRIGGTPTVVGTQTYTYTISTTGPCIKPTATGTITVNALPIATFNTVGLRCANRNVSFNNTSTPNAAGITIWAWDFGDPGSGPLNTSGALNPSHNYLNPNTAPGYTVTLSVTNSNGCVSNPLASIVVAVNDTPRAGFIVPDVCINDVATIFTDTSTINPGNSITSWFWDFGDPPSGPLNTATTQHGTHLYPMPAFYDVMHKAISNFGCRDSIVQRIVINSADPLAAFTPANSCSSDSASITNQSTVGFGSVTRIDIYWDVVGTPGVFQTILNPIPNGIYRHKYPTSTTTRNYTVRIVAYSGVICFNNSVPKTLTSYATPVVQFNAIPNTCYLVAPFQITQGSEIGGVPGTGTYSGGPYITPGGLFNPQVAGIGTHNITYTWTASNPGACIDTLTRTITVLDTAHATFSYVLPACEQTPVSFTDLSTAPAGVTLTNTVWDFGDGTPIENHPPGSTFTHVFVLPLIRTVTMHNVFSVVPTPTTGCLSTDTIALVSIDPNHVILTPANATQTLCVNNNITPINFQLSGGATGIQMPPAGLPPGVTATLTGTVVTLAGAPTLAGVYAYSIQTTGNACQLANASGIITVNPDHEITRIVSAGDSAQSVCLNTPIDAITYNFSGGATGIQMPPAGLPPGVIATVTGNIVTISGTPTAAGTFNYTIQTTGNACIVASAIGEVIVHPYPVPAFAFDKASYCIPNANVGFINNTTPAPLSNHTYTWDFGDGGSSTAVSPSHLYTSDGPFAVILKARSTVVLNGGVIGCESSKNNLLDIVHPQPKADFVPDKSSLCIGAEVILTDATDGMGALVNEWHWNLGDGTNDVRFQRVPHTYGDTGTYIITMYSVNAFGCNSDTINKLPITIPYKPITVYPYPKVNAGPDKSVLEGGSVQLESIVTAKEPQYSWTPVEFLSDAHILNPRVIDPKTDMTYTLKVTGKGGCELSDAVFVKLLRFPVIPNTFTPNNDGRNDKWFIEFLNTYPNNRVQIFTRAGNLIFESRGYNTPWDGTFKGKPMPFDTYYYIIEPGNGRDPITGYVTILK